MSVWIALLFAAAPHSVAVDLSALDRRSYQELDAVSLERALVVRLIQEGFAVVAPTSAPEVRLRLTRQGHRAELASEDDQVVIELDLKNLREFHFEVAQKAVELAREAGVKLDAKTVKPASAPKPTAEPAPEPPPLVLEPLRGPFEPKWNVLVASGALFRGPGADPRASLAARFAAAHIVGLHLEVGLSAILGSALTVYDGSLLLGVGLAFVNRQFVRLELGLSLGVALHTYALADASAFDRFGTRFDFLGRPFVRFVVNPLSGLLVWAQVGGGLTSRAREHRFLNEVLSSRGALWVDAQAGLGWEL